ncbi:hypothetical protein PLESTM_001199300 [Pleodorina starrii]|nr:hypothetical protein PLESTM_001199300 [Pleodorina starrii]
MQATLAETGTASAQLFHDSAGSIASGAGGRRGILAGFGNGPVMSRIQESLKAELQNTTNDIEDQVAKIVAKQVGDQAVQNMNNITAGALSSMGFDNPAQLGEYIGSWAGWLITVLTTAANTAISGGGGGGGAMVATTTTTEAAAGSGGGGGEYDSGGGGSGAAVEAAAFGNVTETDLLRLQQVLRQLEALQQGNQPQVSELRGTETQVMPATGSGGSGGGGGGAVNRTELESAVAELVWRAMSVHGHGGNGTTSLEKTGQAGSGGGGVEVNQSSQTMAQGAAFIRGLAGAKEQAPSLTGGGGGGGGGGAAAEATVVLRHALANNDTAAASAAVATLLTSLKNSKLAAGAVEVGSGGGGGGTAEQATPAAPASTAAAAAASTGPLQLLPLPGARTPKAAANTAAVRAPRPEGRDGPQVNVGRDFNVNVNVNVVPANINAAGDGDGCACTCPKPPGLVSALTAPLVNTILPGMLQLVSGGGMSVAGLLRSGDAGGGGGGDGAMSMQQSAPQPDADAAGGGVAGPGATRLGSRAAAMEGAANDTRVRPLRRWRPLALPPGGSASSYTGSGAVAASSDRGSSSVGSDASGSNSSSAGGTSAPDVRVTASSVDESGGGVGEGRSEVWRRFAASGSGRRGSSRRLRATSISAGAAASSAAKAAHRATLRQLSEAPADDDNDGASSGADFGSWYGSDGDAGGASSDGGSGDPGFDLRASTGSGPGGQYDTQGTAAGPSDEQILNLLQALLDQAAGGDVAIKVGVRGDGGGSGSGASGVGTRAATVPIANAGGAGNGGGSGKAANTNINPIVLPSAQRSGTPVVRGTGGVAAGDGACPPCTC